MNEKFADPPINHKFASQTYLRQLIFRTQRRFSLPTDQTSLGLYSNITFVILIVDGKNDLTDSDARNYENNGRIRTNK